MISGLHLEPVRRSLLLSEVREVMVSGLNLEPVRLSGSGVGEVMASSRTGQRWSSAAQRVRYIQPA